MFTRRVGLNMLRRLTRNQIASKTGLSNSFVDCFLSRPEFSKLDVGSSFIISSAFKNNLRDFLMIKLSSARTTEEKRAKYIKLIKSKFSCLDK
jgi:hypothetical protein